MASNISRIEALADSWIAYGTRFLDPESEEYRSRNPGALKAFSPKQPKTEKELRVFDSWLNGYQALLFDLRIKCSGKSRSKVTSTSTLTDLVVSYKVPHTTAGYMARFLRKALNDPNITDTTELKYFIEGTNGSR